MLSVRIVLASLAGVAAGLPVVAQAQAPNLAAATYLSLEVGTGKLGISCPATGGCSRVDSSGTLRAGHRLDASWAFEVSYSHTSADWGFLGANQSGEFTGFAVGAAYALPVTDSLTTLLRFGGASNEVKFQPAASLFGSNPPTLTTRSIKPYIGVGLSWQFARHWSVSLNGDWTRADVRETASGPKQTIGVRTLGAGIAFNF